MSHCIINQLVIFLTITVIDDGSTDNTKQIIGEKFPKVLIISGDGSLWWTGAISLGLQSNQSDFNDNDYFLLVNSDVELSEKYYSLTFK